MIAHVDGKINLVCEGCFRRIPQDDPAAAAWVRIKHVADPVSSFFKDGGRVGVQTPIVRHACSSSCESKVLRRKVKKR